MRCRFHVNREDVELTIVVANLYNSQCLTHANSNCMVALRDSELETGFGDAPRNQNRGGHTHHIH